MDDGQSVLSFCYVIAEPFLIMVLKIINVFNKKKLIIKNRIYNKIFFIYNLKKIELNTYTLKSKVDVVIINLVIRP